MRFGKLARFLSELANTPRSLVPDGNVTSNFRIWRTITRRAKDLVGDTRAPSASNCIGNGFGHMKSRCMEQKCVLYVYIRIEYGASANRVGPSPTEAGPRSLCHARSLGNAAAG